ncbi:MAG: hypothetical protein LBG72_10265 [Spirochaetaceae bacterium]|jgi:DNA-binding transcriptional regulator YiaG|nr:hypothetical protein [Spirochaetaceae bacterium]
MKKKKYQSEILMVIHQDMEDLYKIGAISAERMQHFNKACLVPETEPPESVVFRAHTAIPSYTCRRA